MKPTELSDDELVSRLAEICLEAHRLTARLIVHLIEVDERRLDLKTACTSMFDFCVRRLGMSRGAAYRRVVAARLVRQFPRLLQSLERGELHLTTLVLLRPHLTEANVDELVAAVKGKSQREIEELLARLAPRPDVPSTLEKVRAGAPPAHACVAQGLPRPVRIEPLAEDRYRVQLTASATLRDKLERARDLMMHRNPTGDLAVVIERALDVLLEKLERERLAKTARQVPPRVPSVGTRDVPRAVRREVFARDGDQCTFVDGEGRRCPSRAFLELDHVESRALGGGHEASNLRVRCQAHNRLHAEEVFGKQHVARRIDSREQASRRDVDAGAAIGSAAIDLAVRGLVSMGFAKRAARRAIQQVSARQGGVMPPPAPPQAPAQPLAPELL
jgi:5-methylcytosine-specific restriction endonuclease McrA